MQGVTIYISDFKRSLTDRLAKDFFDEPSQVLPLACCQFRCLMQSDVHTVHAYAGC